MKLMVVKVIFEVLLFPNKRVFRIRCYITARLATGWGKGWRQWMVYTKGGSDAWTEKEPCRQHPFSTGFWWGCTWFGIRKGIGWNNQQPDAFTRNPLLPSFPADPHRQAQIVDDGILHYDKAGFKVTEKVEDDGEDR